MRILFVFVAMSTVFFGSGLLTAVIAMNKGYRPWFWVLALGPVGTLLMLLKPSLSEATTPEAREAWENRADWTGGILSGFSFFFVFLFPIAGLMTYTFAAVRPMPLPAPAPVMTSTSIMIDEPSTPATTQEENISPESRSSKVPDKIEDDAPVRGR